MIQTINWKILEKLIYLLIKRNNLDKIYLERVNFEIKEINKQGANDYWVSAFNEKKRWNHNNNGLVIPWLLGLTPIDPIKGTNKLYIHSQESPMIEGVEIELENNQKIITSKHTLIKTNKGWIKAININENDQIILRSSY